VIARALARAQIARPTVRAVLAVALVAAAWLAWSPGTRFGLVGAYGGWRYASIRLLDVGLVPLAVTGALAGSGPRERRLDEHLRTLGLSPTHLVGAVAGSGAWVGLAVLAAWAVGAAAGGWLRAVVIGGSAWAGPTASSGAARDLLLDGRLVVAAALVGALGALVGWLVRRDDLAIGAATLLSIGYLPEWSAALGRLPVTIDALAFSPLGAVRVAAFADRGLAAPGYARPAAALPFGAVLAAWGAVLVVAAVPRRTRRRSPRSGVATTATSGAGPGVTSRVPGLGAVRRPAPVTVVRGTALAVAVAGTLAFGAVVPARTAAALPWRWQRSWRDAERAGWSSPQTVDRYLQALRSTPVGDPAELVAPSGAVDPAVVASIPRATTVERQPVESMAGPDHVVVRLDFATPIVSGSTAFSSYLIRFVLARDPDQRWRIVGAEGPVADGAAPAPGPGGS